MLFNIPKLSILILFLILTLVHGQSAPQFSITNPVLGAVTTYKLSYILSNNLTPSTTFTVNFSQSYLKVPNGTNPCNIKVGATVVSSPTCTCTSLVCTFKPNYSASASLVVEIDILNITNPLFIYNQAINVSIYFSASVNYNYSIIVSSGNYQPMSMIINSLTQSDYGVGYTPVSYSFNISLNYISKNMQMQITIPS